jgi:hypothetical protein
MIHMRLPIGIAAELRRVLALDFRELLDTETHNQAPGTPFRSIRGRLQHLLSQRTVRSTGDG